MMMILPIDQGVSGEQSPPLRLHNVVELNNNVSERVHEGQMKWTGRNLRNESWRAKL